MSGDQTRRQPCGECHLKPRERCDLCGAVEPDPLVVLLQDVREWLPVPSARDDEFNNSLRALLRRIDAATRNEYGRLVRAPATPTRPEEGAER